MIRSMTGYGRNETGDAAASFVVEVRSLNNRYLDIQVKSPRSLAALEPRIRKTVQERFSRGRFDVNITRSNESDRAGKLTVNEVLAKQYVDALRDLKARFNLSGDVDLSTMVGLPDVILIAEVREDAEDQWKILSACLEQALRALDRMRIEEGAALSLDIAGRLATIEGLIASILKKAPATVESARKRMTETLGKLLNEQPDPVRVAQEIAILAERTDITEELTRLGSHLAQFRALLGGAGGEAIGRKLDFLIQEIGREVNTIASKAMNAEISLDVVTIKSELEKVREQVQNIE